VIDIKVFCCKDCGLDCSFEVTDENGSQIIKKIIHHMHEDHEMKAMPADFMIRIKHSIKNQDTIDTVHPATNKILVAR
jgi:predicted small metal-binding protein